MQNKNCRCFRLVFQLLNISMQIARSGGKVAGKLLGGASGRQAGVFQVKDGAT